MVPNSILSLLLAGMLMCSLGAMSAAAQETITVNVWTQGYDTTVEAARRFAEETGIEVVVEQVGGNNVEYFEAMAIRIATGQAPDAFWNSSSTGLTLGLRNMLEPINRLFEREGLSWDDFFPMARTSNVLRADGIVHALPVGTWTTNLWYNPQIFREAGIEPPHDGWTLQGEYLEAARRLVRDTDGDGETDIWGTLAAPATGPHLLQQLIVSFGGSVLDESWRSVTLNRPKAIDALQFNLDLIYLHQVAPPPGVAASLGNRRVAMTWDGPHMLVHMQTSGLDEDEMGVALSPQGPVRRASYGDTRNFAIPVNAQNKEAAWRFMVFLLRPDIQLLMSQVGDWTPITRIPLTDWHYGPGPQPENAQAMLRQLDYAVPFERAGEVEVPRGIFLEEYTKAHHGQADLRTVMENVVTRGNAALRDWWAEHSPN